MPIRWLSWRLASGMAQSSTRSASCSFCRMATMVLKRMVIPQSGECLNSRESNAGAPRFVPARTGSTRLGGETRHHCLDIGTRGVEHLLAAGANDQFGPELAVAILWIGADDRIRVRFLDLTQRPADKAFAERTVHRRRQHLRAGLQRRHDVVEHGLEDRGHAGHD